MSRSFLTEPATPSLYGWSGSGARWVTYLREVSDPRSDRYGQSMVVASHTSEDDAMADAFARDLAENDMHAGLASAWARQYASLDLSDIEHGESMLASHELDDFWYSYEPDEVADSITAEQLSRRAAGSTNREPVKYSDPLPYSPAAMPGLLDEAFRGRWSREEHTAAVDHPLIKRAQAGDSDALLELAAEYAGILQKHGIRAANYLRSYLTDDEVKAVVWEVFTEAVMSFDLENATPEQTLRMTGLNKRFAPVLRQAAAENSVPTHISGQRLGEETQSREKVTPPRVERMRKEDVKPTPNIGVLLDEMGETVSICGMTFTREQIQMASEEAHRERVAYARFGTISTGSRIDWDLGDYPRFNNNVGQWTRRLTVVENDKDAESDQVVETVSGTIAAHTIVHDPSGEARVTQRWQRDFLRGLMSNLNERQVDVVSAVFGLDRDPLTQEQYAEEHGVSQQAVSKSLRAALDAMRKAATTKEEA